MNLKKICSLTLASLLALNVASVFAYDYGFEKDTITEPHTTVSIIETSKTIPNISFSVPLYVTMAISNDSANLQTPSNYAIENTSPEFDDGTGTMVAPEIGVREFTIEGIPGGEWSLQGLAPGDTALPAPGAASPIYHELNMLIGGLPMPAVAAVAVADTPVPVTPNAFEVAGTVPAGNSFVVTAAATDADLPVLVPFVVGAATKIPLLAASTAIPEITPADLDHTGAGTGPGATGTDAEIATHAAQAFKIVYTISLLDEDDKPFDLTYAGDDHEAAYLAAAAASDPHPDAGEIPGGFVAP